MCCCYYIDGPLHIFDRPDGKPLSKNALKKQQKEAEKAAKKAQKQAEKEAAAKQEDESDCSKDFYGNMKMIQSAEKLGKW